MINHIRSLLLNQTGSDNTDLRFPGEVFTPPDFKERQLPLSLTTALRQLFGQAPDRLYRNYRAYQLMQLLHTTELDEHMRLPDSRITYWPPRFSAFFDGVFTQAVETIAGDAQIYLTGSLPADDQVGLSQYSWRIEVLNPGEAHVERLYPSYYTSTYAYDVNNGLSEPLRLLSNSNFAVQFRDVPGSVWKVSGNARPQEDIGERLLRFGHCITDELLLQIFSRREEPITTYKNLWEEHHLLAYKYGGLLLGLAYFINDQPQVNNG